MSFHEIGNQLEPLQEEKEETILQNVQDVPWVVRLCPRMVLVDKESIELFRS